MRMTIEFSMDNAAFEQNPEAEAARILRVLTDTIETCSDVARGFSDSGRLADINGNRVGFWEITE